MKIFTLVYLGFVLIIAGITEVSGQPQWWRDKHPHIVYYEGLLLDTLKTTLTPNQRININHTERIEQLEKERFLFYGLGVWNLGVRIEGSEKFYEGRNENTGSTIFPSIVINGQPSVEIIAQNVNATNAHNFLFRVVKNNTEEIVSWSIPDTFKKTKDGRFQYAYLGQFNYSPEQLLRIEIYNKHNYKYQDALILDWRKPIVPKLKAQVGYIKSNKAGEEELFHSSIDLQSSKGKEQSEELNRAKEDSFLVYSTNEAFRVQLDNAIKFLNFTIENYDRPYNYHTFLVRDQKQKQDTLDLGEVERSFNLYKEFWREPGKYTLIINPYVREYGGHSKVQLAAISKSVNFVVLPEKESVTAVSLKSFIWTILIILSTSLIAFLWYRHYHRRQFEIIEKKRLVATLRLQSIRARLNPHFVFNALTGIQNLIGKSEIEKANSYLLRFSRITRNVLEQNTVPKLVSLGEEINLLKDYLEMERLRNDFSFEFTLQPSDLDLEIEIPDMLLQPYIENAVKHAVPQKNGDGKIKVVVERNVSNLILKVVDNGLWNPYAATHGSGLKLSKNHIDNLNMLYEDSKLSADIYHDDDGTTVLIKLENWL